MAASAAAKRGRTRVLTHACKGLLRIFMSEVLPPSSMWNEGWLRSSIQRDQLPTPEAASLVEGTDERSAPHLRRLCLPLMYRRYYVVSYPGVSAITIVTKAGCCSYPKSSRIMTLVSLYQWTKLRWLRLVCDVRPWGHTFTGLTPSTTLDVSIPSVENLIEGFHIITSIVKTEMSVMWSSPVE